jgi:hypothetical protein
MHYRYRETVYQIAVLRTCDGDGDTGVTADGAGQPDPVIPLVDAHRERSIEVRVHAARQPQSGAKAANGSGERLEKSRPESACRKNMEQLPSDFVQFSCRSRLLWPWPGEWRSGP